MKRRCPKKDIFYSDCKCGRQGCPSLKMKWSNKINPYKPPVIQDFQKAWDRLTPESIRIPR